MKIAILGTRGIPANYGGFETFAEECGAGLAGRGHQVTVYCRSHYVSRTVKTHRGVDLVVLPTLRSKYLDTVTHTFLSVIHSLFRDYDVMLICNAANGIYAWLPRVFGTPVAVNVDGIERLRRKWNRLGRGYYRLSEYLATVLATVIVSDAKVIERYYRDTYGKESVFIPYGAVTRKPSGRGTLDALDLVPQGYFLYVSRLEPENNAHLVIQAFERVSTAKRLAVVGDAPYARKYIREVKSTRDRRIIFPGPVYGEGYWELMANACCYIHATEVGGSHPALLEAMGQGNIIIANDTPENAEVLGDGGIRYRKNNLEDLARCLQEVADAPGNYQRFKQAALDRARTEYSWEGVVLAYEQLFSRLIEG